MFFCLHDFACFRYFLIRISNLISIRVFTFCSCSSEEPLFSQWLISLLYRLDRLIPCCLEYLSVSRLFFQFPTSHFLSLGSWEKDFSLLFRHNSFHYLLIYFFFVSVCVVLWCFGHYYLAFVFGQEILGFSVFSISVTILDVSWYTSLYICWRISNISASENQPSFIIVLTWSASLWFVILNLANSVPISNIFFLYLLCAGNSKNNSIVLVGYLA